MYWSLLTTINTLFLLLCFYPIEFPTTKLFPGYKHNLHSYQMSINQQYHCPSDFPQTHLWSQYLIPTNTSNQELLLLNNMTNINDEKIPKLPLFEKSLTPSDVGKLNRLVIPKQHAERYFPSNDAESVSVSEKGFLLSFEDDQDVAKSWRFRYSYWNSSQSYVLTKGWSRFVKEKKLEAGDVVLFFRHRADATRLFIGWRRRNAAAGAGGGGQAGGGGGSKVVHPYPNMQNQPHSLDSGSSAVLNQTIAPSGNCRRLRLFGVNLECQLADESESSTPNDSPMSSQSEAYQHQYHHYYYNHMDINFSSGGEDVYRQG